MIEQQSSDKTSERRFREILAHAWHHSSFYRELYRGHGIRERDLAHIALDDLPITTKVNLMGNFDEAVTDPRLRRAELEAWSKRDLNPMNLYLDEYIVLHSSGGTQTISYLPYSRRAWQLMTATAAPALLPAEAGEQGRVRSAFYFLDWGHYASSTNASFASRTGHDLLHISIRTPVEEVCAQLNRFQPDRVHGLSSYIGYLADWAREGKLRIAPHSIVVTGERLTPHNYATIQEVWGAGIYDLYATSESLYMALRSPQSSEYRVFDSLNLLEVVDGDYRMVQPGQRGRVLLTSLLHTTLPLIRFDLRDLAVLGETGFAATSLRSLDGRANGGLPIQQVNGAAAEIPLHELHRLESLLQPSGLQQLRFVSHAPDKIEIQYRAQTEMDALIRDQFRRLAAEHSAELNLLTVGRVARIHNHGRTFKRVEVARLDDPVLPLPPLLGDVPDNRRLPRGAEPGGDKRAAFAAVAPAQSVCAVFAQVAAQRANGCAATDGERQITYADLERTSARVAGELLRRGFDAARPVAVWAGRKLDSIALALGVLRAGGFFLPLDPHLPPERAQVMLDVSRVQLLLTDADGWETASMVGGEGVTVLRVEDAAYPPDRPLPPVSPETPACLLYTSGTTETPRGVILSHATILQRAAAYADDFRLAPEDRISLAHSAATNAGVRDLFGALLTGASLAVYDLHRRGVSGLADWLNGQRVTVFYAVPTLFRLFLETLTDETFPHVRIVRLGGEPVREEDIVGFRRFFGPGCALVNGYASTEAGTISLYWMGHDTEIVAGRVAAGYPTQGSEIALFDDTGHVVTDAVGEVAVAGHTLASGYWDGVRGQIIPLPRPFPTGDLGFRLDDGRLFLTGRRDAVVKLNGYRVHLGEVEAAVNRLPGVVESAAVVHDTAGKRESLVVYYTTDDGRLFSAAALRRAAAAALPMHGIPLTFASVDSLPRLPNGKLDRDALRIGWQIPGVSPIEDSADEVPYQNEMEARLARIWQEVLGVADVPRHADFLDLGGDSVTVFRTLNRIQETFGVAMTVGEFFANSTVAQLAAKLSL